MLKNKNIRFGSLLIFLDCVIIVGLCICLTQIITQWNNLGAVITYVDMWTGNIFVSTDIALFISFIAGATIAISLFIWDLIKNILRVKRFIKN